MDLFREELRGHHSLASFDGADHRLELQVGDGGKAQVRSSGWKCRLLRGLRVKLVQQMVVGEGLFFCQYRPSTQRNGTRTSFYSSSQACDLV